MTATKHYVGVGFNGGFVNGELPFPQNIQRLEAGPSLICNREAMENMNLGACHLSLHLARAPFCEAEDIQDAFVDHLCHIVSKGGVDSVGIHLCGPFNRGMGYFGLGTGFVRSRQNEMRSLRLLSKLVQSLDCPVLLENADHYHNNRGDALAVVDWTNELCAKTGAALILDVSHSLITAHNIGIDPRYLLGRLDLGSVRVIHLSGITVGRRGELHDGHNKPVHHRVWKLLDETLALLSNRVDLVLEHTDPCWAGQPEKFTDDLELLRGCASERHTECPDPVDTESAGIGYMANIILPARFPEVVKAVGRKTFVSLVRAWADAYLQAVKGEKERLVFLRPMDDFLRRPESIDPIEDFRQFLIHVAQEQKV